jgi:molecular chaperone DnaK
MKIGEAMYAQSQSGEGGDAGPDASDSKEDVVDADFEEVDDDEKKSA